MRECAGLINQHSQLLEAQVLVLQSLIVVGVFPLLFYCYVKRRYHVAKVKPPFLHLDKYWLAMKTSQ